MKIPTLVLELLTARITLEILLSRMIVKETIEMLAYNPVEFNRWKILAKNFINSARQNQFIHAIAMKKNSASLDSTLKIHSRINSSILDNLQHSEVVS